MRILKSSIIFLLCIVCGMPLSVAQECKTQNNLENCKKVLLKTTMGDITVALYNETPKHRDNFLKIVKDSVYNGVLFHRVIKDFMIQGGDPDSKNATAEQMLGNGDLGYTVEAEFVYPKYFHKKGALAAARTGDQTNPERRSSSCQFYIVTGNVYSEDGLVRMESRLGDKQKQDLFNKLVMQNVDKIRLMQQQGDSLGLNELQNDFIAQVEAEYAMNPFHFTQEQKLAYTTIGGTPHLDGQYTVYGEVVEGMDVVDKIQSVETGAADRPKDDVKIISATILE